MKVSLLVIGMICSWCAVSHWVECDAVYISIIVFSGIFGGVLAYRKGKGRDYESSEAGCKKIRTVILPISSVFAVALTILLLGFRSSTQPVLAWPSLLAAIHLLSLPVLSVVFGDYEWQQTKWSILIAEVPGVLAMILARNYQMGSRPLFRLVIIIAWLTIMLWFVIYPFLRLNKVNSEYLFLSLLLGSIVLTCSLNNLMDQSEGMRVFYEAMEVREGCMYCRLSDGYVFSYPYCPVQIGQKGSVLQYDGWFCIQYLTSLTGVQ